MHSLIVWKMYQGSISLQDTSISVPTGRFLPASVPVTQFASANQKLLRPIPMVYSSHFCPKFPLSNITINRTNSTSATEFTFKIYSQEKSCTSGLSSFTLICKLPCSQVFSNLCHSNGKALLHTVKAQPFESWKQQQLEPSPKQHHS
jgi:hypothetical protein